MSAPADPLDGAQTSFADSMSYGDYLHLERLLGAQDLQKREQCHPFLVSFLNQLQTFADPGKDLFLHA